MKCVANSVSPAPASCGSEEAAGGSPACSSIRLMTFMFHWFFCPLDLSKSCVLELLGGGGYEISNCGRTIVDNGSWEIQFIPLSGGSQSGGPLIVRRRKWFCMLVKK